MHVTKHQNMNWNVKKWNEKCDDMRKILSASRSWKEFNEFSGPNWGGQGGRRPPQDSQNFFLLVSLIQCSIYVHAYQDLVHFSTWIILIARGCWYGVFGMMAQKKFSLLHKNISPQEICELALLNEFMLAYSDTLWKTTNYNVFNRRNVWTILKVRYVLDWTMPAILLYS